MNKSSKHNRVDIPWITLGLIGIHAGLFLFELSLDGRGLARFFDRWALVPSQLFVSASRGELARELPTLLTSGALHGGWTHLLGNMLFLWIFGDQCECRLGHVRFALVYVVSGLAASLAQFAVEPLSPVAIVGASGAIAGLLGAYFQLAQPLHSVGKHRQTLSIHLFFFPHTALPVILVIGVWFTLQFFNGVAQLSSVQTQNGGVAFFAHIGGFVAGILLIRILGTSEP